MNRLNCNELHVYMQKQQSTASKNVCRAAFFVLLLLYDKKMERFPNDNNAVEYENYILNCNCSRALNANSKHAYTNGSQQ